MNISCWRQFAAALILTGILAFTHDARAQQWTGAWGAAPDRAQDGAHDYQDWTVRTTVRLGAGGSQIRIRLSNELTAGRIVLGSVHVALPGKKFGSIDLSTDAPLTFSGQTTVTLPAHASILSDALPLTLPAMDDLIITYYVAAAEAGPTVHSLGAATSHAARGYQVSAEEVTSPGEFTTMERVIVSGVDVLQADAGGTIVTLGDSITDGVASTVDANQRWPDYLVQRLQADPALAHLGVVNAGISGNRLLRDQAGPSVLSRLPRDVFAQPNLRYICVLIGVNDISNAARSSDPADAVTAFDLIDGYRQIIARTHELGAKVLISTITPFGGVVGSSSAPENVRQQVNDWIRHGPGNDSDGAIDFDAAIRDPGNPAKMLPAYDSGDHLHPSDAGYAAMAESIDLDLFKADGERR